MYSYGHASGETRRIPMDSAIFITPLIVALLVAIAVPTVYAESNSKKV